MGKKERYGRASKEPARIEGVPMYLDAFQVARVLGLALATVYKSTEEFGAIQVRGNWRFPVDRLPGQPGYRPLPKSEGR